MSTSSLAAVLPAELKQLKLRPLFIFQIYLVKPRMVGKTPSIDRRVAEIAGGTFEGERLRGEILSGGSDWQATRDDGALSIDVRFIMETDDGALIAVTYRGLRHGPREIVERITRGEIVSPADYYLRAAVFFETGSEKYNFLNDMVAIATGHRLPTGPIYQVFEVL